MKIFKTTTLSLTILSLVFIFSSCGKYEEGPKFSLASKEGRLTNEWKLDREIENGVEQTLDADDRDDITELTKDGTVIKTDPGKSTLAGTWVFSNSKEDITITYPSYFGASYVVTFKILRLKSKELWVKFIEPGTVNLIEWHFIKA